MRLFEKERTRKILILLLILVLIVGGFFSIRSYNRYKDSYYENMRRNVLDLKDSSERIVMALDEGIVNRSIISEKLLNLRTDITNFYIYCDRINYNIESFNLGSHIGFDLIIPNIIYNEIYKTSNKNPVLTDKIALTEEDIEMLTDLRDVANEISSISYQYVEMDFKDLTLGDIKEMIDKFNSVQYHKYQLK